MTLAILGPLLAATGCGISNAAWQAFQRGLAHQNKGETDQAIADYTEAIRLKPGFAEAYCNRGNAYGSRGDTDKAITDYTEAIRLNPDLAEAYYGRGLVYGRNGDTDRAIADCSEAIWLDPDYATAYCGRGNAWQRKQDYDRAIKDCDEAIRLDPKFAPAHYMRSVALMLMERREAAGGFRNVLDIEGWRGRLSTYAVILGHLAARQTGDAPTARQFLDDATGKLDEVWPYPVVKFLRGEIDEQALLALATDDDKRTEARCFLGLDYLLKGRKTEALADFRWVKEHGNVTFVEYMIALAELKRLESGAEP